MPPNGAVEGGAVGRLVPVDHAGADVRPEAVVERRIAADEAGGKAVAGGVGLGERRVEIGDADQLEHRAEQLGVGALGDVGGVEQGRSQEGALVVLAVEPAIGREPLPSRSRSASCERVGGGGVDHRAHEGSRAGVRMIDDQPVDQLDDGVDQLLMPAVLDDQATRGGAALAGAHIGGLDGDRGGGVNVPRLPDDERVVAAHFEGEESCAESRHIAG